MAPFAAQSGALRHSAARHSPLAAHRSPRCLAFGVKPKTVAAKTCAKELTPRFLLGVLWFQVLAFRPLGRCELSSDSGVSCGGSPALSALRSGPC